VIDDRYPGLELSPGVYIAIEKVIGNAKLKTSKKNFYTILPRIATSPTPSLKISQSH